MTTVAGAHLYREEIVVSDENVKWSWWPWVLAAAAGSAAGLVLAAVFVGVVM